MDNYDKLQLEIEQTKMLGEQSGFPAANPYLDAAIEHAIQIMRANLPDSAPDTENERGWLMAGLSMGACAMFELLTTCTCEDGDHA